MTLRRCFLFFAVALALAVALDRAATQLQVESAVHAALAANAAAGISQTASTMVTDSADPSTLAPVAAGAITRRSLAARFADTINVKDYLAVGQPDGSTDNCAGIQAAIDAAVSQHGTLYFPPGTYVCSSQLRMLSPQGVRLIGATSNNQVSGGSTLRYTGTASPFFAITGTSASVAFEHLTFTYTNPAFRGTLLKTSCNQLTFRNVVLTGSGAASAQYLLDLDRTVDVLIDHVGFLWAQYGISGQKSDGTGFSNAVQISQSQFSWLTVSGIRNPGGGWSITSTDFEALQNGQGSAITMDPACQAYGTQISGSWMGDATARGAFAWIAWQGHGLTVTGNYINGTGHREADAIRILGTSYGITIQGNSISAFRNGVNLGSYVSNGTSISGNHFSGCTKDIDGSPAADYFSFKSGQWTPTFSNLAVVNGAGSVSYAGYWKKEGLWVTFSAVISPSSGATTASTAGSAVLNNLPFPVARSEASFSTCSAANTATGQGIGVGLIASGGAVLPGWVATSNAIVITGTYQTSMP